MLRTVTLLLLAIALSSCDFNFWPGPPRNRVANVGNVDAYVPVYAQPGTVELTIGSQPPRTTEKAGKIFALGNKLFQVEEHAGIHVIDYSDKSHPVKLAFFNIPGCTEISVKENYVFTNNFNDMLVLDFSTYPDLKVEKRIKNVFPEQRYLQPPRNTNVLYKVCEDYTKGIVVKWEVKKVNNPQCYAQ